MLYYINMCQEGNLNIVKKQTWKYLLCCAGFSTVIFKDWGIKHLSLLPAGVDVKNYCHSLACYSILHLLQLESWASHTW